MQSREYSVDLSNKITSEPQALAKVMASIHRYDRFDHMTLTVKNYNNIDYLRYVSPLLDEREQQVLLKLVLRDSRILNVEKLVELLQTLGPVDRVKAAQHFWYVITCQDAWVKVAAMIDVRQHDCIIPGGLHWPTVSLLNRNPQLAVHGHYFNHEAVAILLSYLNKSRWHKQQVFLLAGTVDLKVLLPRLALSDEGSEAFIVLRPFMHCIAIYLKKHNGRFVANIFDPQAWGKAFKPNCLVKAALKAYFPGIELNVEQEAVQAQFTSYGCTVCSLAYLHHIAMGKSQDPITAFKGFNIEVMQQQYLRLLDKLLQEQYVEDGKLSYDAIMQVVNQLQGISLPPLAVKAFVLYQYQIKILQDDVKIVCHFTSKNFLFENCLVFATTCSGLRVKNVKSDGKLLLIDNPAIKNCHIDHELRTITYHGTSLQAMRAAFAGLANSSASLFQLHMRQQLGVITVAQEIVEAIDASLSKKHEYNPRFFPELDSDESSSEEESETPKTNFLYRILGFA